MGVIASPEELQLARRMRTPPDLFELRLDRLPGLRESAIAGLRAPLIITARHPLEGGAGNLSAIRRRDLLGRFLPHAAFVDLELRSLAELRDIWQRAAAEKVKRICSVHIFNGTPDSGRLRRQLDRAIRAGTDVFKLVAQAESIGPFVTLLNFLGNKGSSLPLCVMATGSLGPISRILFPSCGSAFVYAPIRTCFHQGQLDIGQLRRLRKIYAEK